MMRKYIHIQKADREFIAKALGITERSVFNAIRFDEKRGETELARRVRRLALERVGVTMVVAPEVETFHDRDQVMRQYFPNGALLELDRKDGRGYVIFHGDTVRTYENVRVAEIGGIQQFAASLR